MSLTNRLRIVFAVLIGLLVAVSILGVGRLFQARQNFEDDTARYFNMQVQVERIRSAFVLQQSALAEAGPEAGRRSALERAANAGAEAESAARDLAQGDQELDSLLSFRAAAERAWRTGVANPVLAGQRPAPGSEQRLALDVAHAGDDLTAAVEDARADSREDSQTETRGTVIVIAAGLITALLAAILLFSGLVRTMREPLRRLVEGARSLADGDLSTRVDGGGPAEIQELSGAFNEMAVALEREARERDRIERMKDDFLLTVSHELRTPVTSVKGFAELLAQQSGSMTAAQREAIDAISTGAFDLSAIIDDLVDLARSDAGRLSINPMPTAVRPLLERVARQLRPQFEERGQKLRVSVPRELPRARIDPDRIVQVLTNLLTNANKYGPEGGTVRLTAQREGRAIAIAVADDGPGLSKEAMENAFERFWREDTTVTQRVGGSGLGLSIARSLVELHGGEIRAEANEHGGSTFLFTVPATRRPASGRGGATRPTAGARR
jgi:signal transduction histidine kinase